MTPNQTKTYTLLAILLLCSAAIAWLVVDRLGESDSEVQRSGDERPIGTLSSGRVAGDIRAST